jgi:hypothetical protein
MKVFNSKLAAIGLAAFVFASCSDNTSDPTGGSSPAKVDATTLDLTNSGESLFSSVINYKNTTANARKFFGTRAANDAKFATTFDMPEQKNTDTQIYGKRNLDGGRYYLKESAGECDFSKNTIKNATIFVNGDAKLIYSANTFENATIVVKKGGSLIFKGTGSMIKQGVTVYNELGYVKTEDPAADIVIEGNLYSSWRGITSGLDENDNAVEKKELKSGLGQLTADKTSPTQKITFMTGSKACIIGSIRGTEVNVEEGANIYASAHVWNATTVNINGNLQIGGFLKTADLNLNTNGYLKAGDKSAIKVTNILTMNAGSQIDANYINVTLNEKDTHKKVTKVGEAQLILKGACKINIADKGVINVNKLISYNDAKGQISLEKAGGLAILKADEFHNDGAENIQAFDTPAEGATFLFQFTKCFNGENQLPTAEDLDIAASYLDYDKATTGDFVKLKDADNKQYGYELTATTENLSNKPKLDLFSAAGVTENTLSATSIQAANDKLYVTYHTQGNDKSHMGGGLEVAHIDGKNLILDQAVSAQGGLDVNYGMIDGNRFYVAATSYKEGAFLGYANLSNGQLSDTKLVTYPIDKTNPNNGIDANSVVKYKDNFVLATNKGYQVYNSTFTLRTPHLTTNDVKFVAVGNDKLYGLEANGTTTGTVNIFNNINLENPQSYTTEGKVGVVDGKNTIAVDGTNLYVCQGDGGLVRYDAQGNGTVLFDAPAGSKDHKIIGRVNGVAVDSKYIYVACGGYGLVVLDKTKAKGENVVARRRAFYDGKESYNSANYVTLYKDYICVAYGRSRVQIFKLVNTK